MGFFAFGKTIIASIFKKPATRMYPVVPREWEERTRGSVSIVGDDCIGCSLCAKACPCDAISVDKEAGTWTIERMQCIQCSACVDKCPKKCLTMENLYTIPDVVKVVDTFEIPKKDAKKPAKAVSAKAKDDKVKDDKTEESNGDGGLTCDDTCVFCGLCAKECPCDAIEVTRKPEKSWRVDKDACIECGACVDKCPKGSLSL